MCTAFDAQGRPLYSEISQTKIGEYLEGEVLTETIVSGAYYSFHDVDSRHKKATFGKQTMCRTTPRGAGALYTHGGKGRDCTHYVERGGNSSMKPVDTTRGTPSKAGVA